jgi:hypothetical protein
MSFPRVMGYPISHCGSPGQTGMFFNQLDTFDIEFHGKVLFKISLLTTLCLFRFFKN